MGGLTWSGGGSNRLDLSPVPSILVDMALVTPNSDLALLRKHGNRALGVVVVSAPPRRCGKTVEDFSLVEMKGRAGGITVEGRS